MAIADPSIAGQPISRGIRWQSRREVFASFLALLVVLVLWEVLPRLNIIDHRLIPPPSSLFSTTRLMFDQDFAGAIGNTLLRFALGMIVGTVVGLFVGLVSGLSRLGRAIFSPLLAVVFPIPLLTLFPVILSVFGRHYFTYVALVALGPFFTMAITGRGACVLESEPDLSRGCESLQCSTP
jgi:NitT/TauT family transport system permease protein